MTDLVEQLCDVPADLGWTRDSGAHDNLDIGRRCHEAAARIRELEALLQEHHQWHLRSGIIGLQDGNGGWVEIDNAAEYSDSLMRERTEKALEGAPPDDAGPMPRGGVQQWWWQVGVMERRKRRAAEVRIEKLTEALRKIKKLKPEAIGDTVFVVGPLALLQAAQRIARAALSPATTDEVE